MIINRKKIIPSAFLAINFKWFLQKNHLLLAELSKLNPVTIYRLEPVS